MNLTILSESHPKRCEVCHQSDVVEPVPWFCQLPRLTPEAVKALPLPQR